VSTRDIGIAIGLPEPYAAELRAARRRFGDPQAPLVPPHITLLPPTPVPAARMEQVAEHLRAVARQTEAFAIELHGSATFRPVSPVVFVPLVSGIGPCEVLQSWVRSGPLHRELRFPYHPHVTVVHDVADGQLDAAYAELADYRASFRACGFSLFERDQDGVWSPRCDFGFGPAAPGA
jgi:2'-5' RNA ligase